VRKAATRDRLRPSPATTSQANIAAIYLAVQLTGLDRDDSVGLTKPSKPGGAWRSRRGADREGRPDRIWAAARARADAAPLAVGWLER